MKLQDRVVFRTLVTLEEANARLLKHFVPSPVGSEEVSVLESRERVLAEDIVASIDVPGFDRAAMDGFAVKASDTYSAEEVSPITLQLKGAIEAGDKPSLSLDAGETIEISTGAPVPTGANGVVMVEYTHKEGKEVKVYRAVSPGENVMPAGSDIMVGELVLRKGQMLTPRELGVLGALGLSKVKVFTRPRVAIISTGNEIIEAGKPLQYGKIYDINGATIAASVAEAGGEPITLGILPDDTDIIKEKLSEAFGWADMVLTSGSTSAGFGDRLYKIVEDLGEPGILAHGLSLKPGKPTIVAVVRGKPFFGLPGYPTSALMIFSILVRPVLRRIAGLQETTSGEINGRAAQKIFSGKGRRELLPVHVVRDEGGLPLVYPVHAGSGAIMSMAMADGFIDIPENQDFIVENDMVKVFLFGNELKPADLVIIGSHCIGVDIILQLMHASSAGLNSKVINAGSLAGLNAVSRGEADLAGIHLVDQKTGNYNRPYLEGHRGLVLLRGYDREQGLILAQGNPKRIKSFEDLLRGDVIFINRNPGSGTRVLTDLRLAGFAAKEGISFENLKGRIKGYDVEAKSHSAVANAVLHGRVDAGIGIKTFAEYYGLDFIPLANEKYDFVARASRLQKSSVKKFIEVLGSETFAKELSKRAPGLTPNSETGLIISGGIS